MLEHTSCSVCVCAFDRVQFIDSAVTSSVFFYMRTMHFDLIDFVTVICINFVLDVKITIFNANHLRFKTN